MKCPLVLTCDLLPVLLDNFESVINWSDPIIEPDNFFAGKTEKENRQQKFKINKIQQKFN